MIRVVVPVYNEEDEVSELYCRFCNVLGVQFYSYEFEAILPTMVAIIIASKMQRTIRKG